MLLSNVFARLTLSLLLLLTRPAHRVVNAGVNENQIQAISSYMDHSTDPCDDYYRHACGNWGKVHSNEQYVEITSLMDHKVNKRLIEYFQNYQLEGSPEAGNETYTDKLFLYYQTCRRADKQLKRYLQLVRPSAHLDWQLMLELREPNATWPAERFNWLFTLAKLRRYNFKEALIEHMVLESNGDSKRFVINLDRPTHALPELTKITALLMALGLKVPRALQVASQVRHFENTLRRLKQTTKLEMVSLHELERIMPHTPWRLYLQLVLSYTLTPDYKVELNNREYLVALSEVLQHAPPSLIDNYIMVKFALFLLRDGAGDFTKVDCVWDVRKKMEVAVNFLYKQQLFDESHTKVAADIERIFELTRREFKAKLSVNRMQLQPNQLNYLQRKMSAMRFNIGNLPASVNERFVDDYYADVHLNTNAYYKNHLLLLKLRSRREHDQLTAPPPERSEQHFISDGDGCAPFYLYHRNLVVIPYAFLQPPAYHVNMHDILKMGIFGFVLTHEIMHGFESSGVLFDYSGTPLLTGAAILRSGQFKASVSCLEETSTESIDERMADFAGIRVAFDTLFGANSSMQVKQPVFSDMAPKRLFFLSFAQFFCGNLLANFADHDSDDVRLRQTLSQFEPFAVEYGCRPGDAMYPQDSCQLY